LLRVREKSLIAASWFYHDKFKKRKKTAQIIDSI